MVALLFEISPLWVKRTHDFPIRTLVGLLWGKDMNKKQLKATLKQFKLKSAHKLVVSQIRIRPRAGLLVKVLVILALAFLASSKAVAYLEPKEAEVKINGQTILVAEEKAPAAATVEIAQNIGALRSPFEFDMPINGNISQGYSRYHRALDITSPLGTPIKPIGPGVVEFAGFMPDGKGNVVIVDHGDNLKTLYAHMGKIEVGAGNMVNPSAEVGTVGLTGRTTGPHVHFEVYDQGVAVNPKNLLP